MGIRNSSAGALLLAWKPGCNCALSFKSALEPRLMLSFSGGATLSTELPCAINEGDVAATRSDRSSPRRVEQLSDGIFEFVFPREPDVDRGDFPLAVDYEGGRQGLDAPVNLPHLVVSKQNTIVDLVLLDVRLHHVPAIFVHRNAQHRKAAIFQLLLEFHEPGDFDLAGAAPGCPEIQQHHLAFIVGKMNRLAVGVFESKLRSRLAASLWLYGRVGLDG